MTYEVIESVLVKIDSDYTKGIILIKNIETGEKELYYGLTLSKGKDLIEHSIVTKTERFWPKISKDDKGIVIDGGEI